MTRSSRQTPADVKTRRRSQRLRAKQVDHLEDDSTQDLVKQDGSRTKQEVFSVPSDASEDTVVKDSHTHHSSKESDLDSVQDFSDVDDNVVAQHCDSIVVDDDGADHSGGEREGVDGLADSEDDSDGSPEDISLTESKMVAMETLRNEQEQVKRVQRGMKEKKRKKHELYRKQKVLKRAKVISKFPTEALEEVSLQLAKEKAAKKATKKLKQKLSRGNKTGNELLPSEAHFGTVKVVALSDQEVMGGALTRDFRQEHFYGDRLKRLPALTIQARKYRNIPAKNFIKTH